MTREEQRAELPRVIWQIANDLRGSVDGWDFKSYVLGILFYRYISGCQVSCFRMSIKPLKIIKI